MRRSHRQQHEVVYSETATPVRGCTGKRCYPSQSVAGKLAKRQRRYCDTRVVEYHCRHCHSWHIGEARA